jgi:hypothetical protein
LSYINGLAKSLLVKAIAPSSTMAITPLIIVSSKLDLLLMRVQQVIQNLD